MFVYLLLSLQTGYRQCNHQCPHPMNIIWSWWSMNNIIQYTYHCLYICPWGPVAGFIFHSLVPSLLSKNGRPPFLNWFGKLHPHTYIHTYWSHVSFPESRLANQIISEYGTVEPLYTVDTIGTQLAVLYTLEPLYGGHHWNPAGCTIYSGTSL